MVRLEIDTSEFSPSQAVRWHGARQVRSSSLAPSSLDFSRFSLCWTGKLRFEPRAASAGVRRAKKRKPDAAAVEERRPGLAGRTLSNWPTAAEVAVTHSSHTCARRLSVVC